MDVYAVYAGKNPGIYEDYEEARKYKLCKKCKSLEEAKEKLKKFGIEVDENGNVVDIKEPLIRELYYCDGKPEESVSYKGFIGEAYQRLADLYGNKDYEELINDIADGNRKKKPPVGYSLTHLNDKQTYFYERDLHDDIYTVKFSYFYAAQCSFIYKRMLERFTEEYVQENGLKIVSVGAGNLVDYWALESAILLLGWKKETVDKISYMAYELCEWGSMDENGKAHENNNNPIPRYLNIEKDCYQIKDKKVFTGENGDFFDIDFSKMEADIILFPNVFNELNKADSENFKKQLIEIAKKKVLIALTVHTGEKNNEDSIETILGNIKEDYKNFVYKRIEDEETKEVKNKSLYWNCNADSMKDYYSILSGDVSFTDDEGKPRFKKEDTRYKTVKNKKTKNGKNFAYVIYELGGDNQALEK